MHALNNPKDAGGWPDLKSAPPTVDSDHDGMPDPWEIDHGLNPKNHPRRKDLVAILNREAEAIARYQDKDGLWWDIIDLAGKEKNYHESSYAAMFVYDLAKGVRQGNLPERHLDAARKGWAGIQKEFIKALPDGNLDWEGTVSVSGLGGNARRDGSYEYYMSEKVRTNDAKGLGPAVMAAVEMEKLGPAVKRRNAP
jgi:unsaturated rhamnogalacturonyl hydrolase